VFVSFNGVDSIWDLINTGRQTVGPFKMFHDHFPNLVSRFFFVDKVIAGFLNAGSQDFLLAHHSQMGPMAAKVWHCSH